MDEKRYQFIGLVGFIIAGFVFVAVGMISGDPLTIIGSVIWICSCLVWIFPLLMSK
ncbi:MAG: hypothetical protein ACU0DI_07625 [Paracoccaceae bacterium]